MGFALLKYISPIMDPITEIGVANAYEQCRLIPHIIWNIITISKLREKQSSVWEFWSHLFQYLKRFFKVPLHFWFSIDFEKSSTTIEKIVQISRFD